MTPAQQMMLISDDDADFEKPILSAQNKAALRMLTNRALGLPSD